MPLTLDDMLTALDRADPDAPASFAGPQGATQGHWHVTRVTLARQDHVDCDGKGSADQEAVLELLDGPPGAPMPLSRLASILRQSRAALPDAGPAPLQVFHRSTRSVVDGLKDGTFRITPVHAACRPADRLGCCA